PLLSTAIGKLMGPDVSLVNSGAAAAAAVADVLTADASAPRAGDTGHLRCYTTDNAERFAALGRRFAGRAIDCVEHVDSDELEARAISG
ncbi:MAG: hypothetical protein KAU28_03760, partial [Phycisphaerae bacterium]|nr:hypothetical protein [Phycisphaerae bacterium]